MNSNRTSNFVLNTARGLLLTALVALPAQTCLAQAAEDLRLTVGKSVVIDYPGDIRQISTSNPDVLDASPVTTREILMNAKGMGSATVVVWSRTDQRTFYNVNVEMNLDPLKRMLTETFPNEKIDVRSSRDSISLNGTVSSSRLSPTGPRYWPPPLQKTVVNNLQPRRR